MGCHPYWKKKPEYGAQVSLQSTCLALYLLLEPRSLHPLQCLSSGRAFLNFSLQPYSLSLSLSLGCTRAPYNPSTRILRCTAIALTSICCSRDVLPSGMAPAVRLSSLRLPAYSSLTWHSILVPTFQPSSLPNLSYLLDSRLRYFVGFCPCPDISNIHPAPLPYSTIPYMSLIRRLRLPAIHGILPFKEAVNSQRAYLYTLGFRHVS